MYSRQPPDISMAYPCYTNALAFHRTPNALNYLMRSYRFSPFTCYSPILCFLQDYSYMFRTATDRFQLCVYSFIYFLNSYYISKFFFIHQLIHKWTVLKTILKFTLKFTLKQLRHVSVQSPSSESALFDLAKVTVVKIANYTKYIGVR
jgi:hypothetical protein